MDLVAAINEHLVLAFDYEGHPRVVIPTAYGRNHRGNDVLRAKQIGGTSRSRAVPSVGAPPTFTVSEMRGVRATGETFDAPPEGYSKGDKGLAVIYAEL